MSNAYLVDVGVVVDKDEYPTCYSKNKRHVLWKNLKFEGLTK